MKALETLHLDSATGKKNVFPRPRTHLTTLEIGQIIPIMHEDCRMGDVLNVHEGIFSRLAPLAVPTYGQFYVKTATMFVDYYQVFNGAEAWFTGKSVTRGNTIKLPVISKGALLTLFIDSSISTTVANPTSTAEYDFCYTASDTVNYKKFTSKGKWIYKCMRSLGYQIPNLVSTSAISNAPGYTTTLNALPLLCFFKAYNDYMSQSQRFDTSALSARLEAVKLNKDYSGFYTSSNGALNATGVISCFDLILLQYENDYFTSCWSAPNNPIGDTSGDYTSLSFNSSSSTSRSVEFDANNTKYSVPQGSLSQRSLDFLRSFDSFVRRNSYSGSKDVERVFSRFGIKPESYRSNYAHLVNTSSNIVNVGDVTSMTDTASSSDTGAVLGDYAGKGIVNGDTGYKYQVDDFGMLITLAWIAVKPIYSNGYDRTVLKTNVFDFYQPEFDGLGANPVSRGEVFVDRKNSGKVASDEDTIFGFNERYCEYKTGNLDQITGDFCLFEDMNSWHFDRTDLKALSSFNTLTAQSASFNSYNGVASQNIYNRIFNAEAGLDSMADHFYISAQFDVKKYSNMKSVNEVPNLGEGKTVVPRNGNTLN